MFLSLSQKVRISDIKVQLEEAKRDASQWKQSYERLKDRHDAITAKDRLESDFACNFAEMNAFAIERNVNQENVPCTIVGYKVVGDDGKEVIKEWYMYCSVERHNQLAAEFRKYVKDCK